MEALKYPENKLASGLLMVESLKVTSRLLKSMHRNEKVAMELILEEKIISLQVRLLKFQMDLQMIQKC
jgi:hypothetical protein